METILNSTNDISFQPRAALIAYESNAGSTFLEIHDILRDGTMGEARPVSREFVKSLVAGMSESYNDTLHGFADNILYCDPRRSNETLVWYNPPMKRNRFFDKDLTLEDGVYNVPGTIYAIKDGKLWVFCFKGKAPGRDTPLLKGPFFNIYEDGHVCTGNVNLKMGAHVDKTFENVTRFWEGVFWNSIDLHTIGNSPSTKHNLIETIRKYRDKAFDTKELNPYKNMTLSSFIRELSK